MWIVLKSLNFKVANMGDKEQGTLTKYFRSKVKMEKYAGNTKQNLDIVRN